MSERKKGMPPKWIQVACDHCNGKGAVERVNPKWLREMRVTAGTSLRAMARTIGVSAPFLSDVELGRRNANVAILKAYGAI